MCILLVEDEALIREIVQDALSFGGFDVCEASTGDYAAALIKDPPRNFTLLITDLNLPGMRNGLDVGRLMRGRHPLLPIIYITARPDIVGPLRPRETLLPKPFSLQNLLDTVHGVLAGR